MKKNNYALRRKMEPHVFMSPSYLLIVLFILLPLFNVLRMAFMEYRLARPDQRDFIGFENFINVFSDPLIGMVFRNTAIFVLATVSLQFLLGLILALALKKPFPFRKIYQGIVFLPWAFSSFIVGLNFRWLFNAEYGPINDILLKMGLIDERIVFLGSAELALVTVIIALTWSGIPFFGIMLLASLQSIPADYYEVGMLEGCTGIRSFFYITLPAIKPTVITTVLLRFIWVFNNADLIYVMTGGGPANTSQTLASYMFTRAYSTLDFGEASAIGVIFMIVLLTFSGLFLLVTRFRDGGME